MKAFAELPASVNYLPQVIAHRPTRTKIMMRAQHLIEPARLLAFHYPHFQPSLHLP